MEIPEFAILFLYKLKKNQEYSDLESFIRHVITFCICPEVINDFNKLLTLHKSQFKDKDMEKVHEITEPMFIRLLLGKIKDSINTKIKDKIASINFVIVDKFCHNAGLIAYDFLKTTDYAKFGTRIVEIAVEFMYEVIKETKPVQNILNKLSDTVYVSKKTSLEQIKHTFHKLDAVEFTDPQNKILYEKSIKEAYNKVYNIKSKQHIVHNLKNAKYTYSTVKTPEIPRSPDPAIKKNTDSNVEFPFIDNRQKEAYKKLDSEFMKFLNAYEKDKQNVFREDSAVMQQLYASAYEAFGSKIFDDPGEVFKQMADDVESFTTMLKIFGVSRENFLNYITQQYEEDKKKAHGLDHSSLNRPDVYVDFDMLYNNLTKHLINSCINHTSQEIINDLKEVSPSLIKNANIYKRGDLNCLLKHIYVGITEKIKPFIVNASCEQYHNKHVSHLLDDIYLKVNMKLYDLFFKTYTNRLFKTIGKIIYTIKAKISATRKIMKKVKKVSVKVKDVVIKYVNKTIETTKKIINATVKVISNEKVTKFAEKVKDISSVICYETNSVYNNLYKNAANVSAFAYTKFYNTMSFFEKNIMIMI